MGATEDRDAHIQRAARDTNPMLKIRKAERADAPLIAGLIRELAAYEKAPDSVHTTEADIARDGFGERPQFRVLLAEWDGTAAGYALFFDYYSSWRGRGIYLEDLFILERFRGEGIGLALLAAVARAALEENRSFLRWEVLDWNTRAIDFYKRLGVTFLDGWRSVILDDAAALQRLAARKPATT